MQARARRRQPRQLPIAFCLSAAIVAVLQLVQAETIEICPDAAWHNAVFLKNAQQKSPSFFANITTWSGTQFKDYALHDLSKDYIPSAVFLGIAVLSLALLLLWSKRTVPPLTNAEPDLPRYVAYMVPPSDAQHGTAAAMERSATAGVAAAGPSRGVGRSSTGGSKLLPPAPWEPAPHRRSLASRCACLGVGSTVLKVLMVLFIGAAVGLTVWGMTSADKGLADQGWQQVDDVEVYVEDVASKVDALVSSVNATIPAITQAQQAATQALSLQSVNTTVQELGSVLDSQSLSPTALSQGTSSLRTSLTSFSNAAASLPATLTRATSTGAPALQSAAQQVSDSSTQLLDVGQKLSTVLDRMTTMQGSTQPSVPAAENVVSAIQQLDLSSRLPYLASLISDLQLLNSSALATQVALQGNTTNTNTSSAASSVITSLALATDLSNVTASALDQLPALADTIRSYSNTTQAAEGPVRSMLAYLSLLTSQAPGLVQSDSALSTLSARLQSVAALVLDSQGLQDVASALDTLQSQLSTPQALQDTLASLRQGLAPLSSLPSTSGFLSYATSLQSSLQALQQPLSDAQSATSAYLEQPSQATWDLAQAVVSDAISPATSQAVSNSTPAPSTASSIATVRLAASDLAQSLNASNLPSAQLQQQLADALQALGDQLSTLSSSGSASQRLRSRSRALRQAAASGNATAAPLDLLDALASDALSTLDSWPVPRAPSLDAVGAALQLVQQTVLVRGDALKAQVADTVRTFNQSADDLRTALVGRIDDLRDSYKQPTTTGDKWRYIATMIIFSLALAMLACLLLALAFNIPALLTLATLITAVLLALYFALALLLAVVVGGGNDLCPAAETIALDYIPDQYHPVANYLFFNHSTLEAALVASQVVDLGLVDSQTEQLATSIIGNLTVLVGSTQGPLGSALVAANATLARVEQDKAALLQAASHEAFLVVYGGAKGYTCCQAADELVQLWYASTFGGWVLLLLTWLAAALMRIYDRAWGAHWHCGWICLIAPPDDVIQPVAPSASSSSCDAATGGLPGDAGGAAAPGQVAMTMHPMESSSAPGAHSTWPVPAAMAPVDGVAALAVSSGGGAGGYAPQAAPPHAGWGSVYPQVPVQGQQHYSRTSDASGSDLAHKPLVAYAGMSSMPPQGSGPAYGSVPSPQQY